MKETKLLTRSEFQVMTILWNLPGQSGCTGDLLAHYKDPKPAYTTLATFLKILNNKGFVKFKKRNGKLYYTPSVSQLKYADLYLAPAKDIFFGGSFVDMMRYFISKEQLSEEEINELEGLIHQVKGN